MNILRNRHALLAFGMTTCMIMGVNGIVPIVPLLREIFGISPAAASLAITIYTLPGVFFSPVAGVLADRYGRKQVALVSLLLFGCGGVACAFAPNFTILLICRFFQGVGGTSLGVLNTTIIADAFPKNELPRLMGYTGTVISLSTAVYPLAAGLLAILGWRCTFLLPLMALPVFLLALRTPLAGPGSSSGLAQYLKESWRVASSPRYLALFSVIFLTFIMLYGPVVTVFPMLARDMFNASPAAIGSITIAASLGAATTASQLGRLSATFSGPTLMLLSQGFYCLALVLFPFMPGHWYLTIPALLFGLGQGLNVATIMSMLLADAPASSRGAIVSVNGMLLRLGQTVGPLFFGAIMAGFGFSAAFFSGAGVAVVMFVLVKGMRRLTSAPRN